MSSVEFLPEPNNDKVVSASRDCTIKMWDTTSGFCLKTFEGHDQWVRRVVPNATGTMLVTCSDDQSIRMWDVSSGKELEAQIMNGHENVIEAVTWLTPAAVETVITSAEFESQFPAAAGGAGPPPQLVLSGSRDKTIRLWDASTGTCLKVYVRLQPLNTGSSCLIRVSIFIVVNSLHAGCVCVREQKGHDNWVRSVLIGNAGKHFYSCSDDKSVRVWDFNSGRNTKTIADAHSVSLALPAAACCLPRTTCLNLGVAVRQLPPHLFLLLQLRAMQHFVTAMAFQPNQRRMATGGVDCSLNIWPCH